MDRSAMRDHDLDQPEGSGPTIPRAGLLDRWHALTRQILPGMAAAQAWPIRLDHCFMRVCLDDALGVRWDRFVQRPAIRHLTDAQLSRAVAAAERIAADPASLRLLNEASLRMRGKLWHRRPRRPAS